MAIGDNQSGSEKQNKKKMLKQVRTFAEALNKQKLRKNDYRDIYECLAKHTEDPEIPSYSELKYHFKSWTHICLMSGLNPGRSSRISEEDIAWKLEKNKGKIEIKYL